MSTWTESDIDALKDAIKTGIKVVHYSGPPARTVQYHSLEEMLALLATMQQDVATESGGSSYKLAATRKGFCP